MAQAVLDGAFFPIRNDDTSLLAQGLRRLTGPYEVNQLSELAASAVGDQRSRAAFFFSPRARLHFRNGGVTIVVTMTITTTAENTLASTTFSPLMLSPAPGQ